MRKNILIVQGHPDAGHPHLCHALAAAYAQSALESGHEVRTVDVGALDFPLLRSKADWEAGAVPAALAPVQQDMLWAHHLVFFFPLWLGGMPALLKGFLEQVARPGFALVRPPKGDRFPKELLAGRSARLVVTMGMPALVYRWFYRAHSLKALERNILGMVGIAPIARTLVGLAEGMSDAQRAAWLKQLAVLGRLGD